MCNIFMMYLYITETERTPGSCLSVIMAGCKDENKQTQFGFYFYKEYLFSRRFSFPEGQ